MKMTPASFVLEAGLLAGRFIELQPYCEAIKADVRRALDCDSEAWNLFSLSGQGEHFESWWSRLTGSMDRGQWIPYAIRRRSDGEVLGTSSFINIRPERQTVEIGGTFLSPAARSSYVNPESKLLMLEYAFARGARRIELLTDSRNARSQAAIAKLGATREGVLRRDRVTWTGHVRDTVLYSITDLDWPDVRARLRERVDSFTAQHPR